LDVIRTLLRNATNLKSVKRQNATRPKNAKRPKKRWRMCNAKGNAKRRKKNAKRPKKEVEDVQRKEKNSKKQKLEKKLSLYHRRLFNAYTGEEGTKVPKEKESHTSPYLMPIYQNE
jgi:hypothetical protein